MNRRAFLSSLAAGLAAELLPMAARAQTKSARVGFLYYGSRQSTLDTGRYQAFVEGMRELGYVEGKNLVIESRFADGNSERVPTLAVELVGLKVDVIVAGGGSVYRALHHATRTIPVVAMAVPDPVADGLAASLARPGGNFTGLSISADDLGPKHLELLRAATPKLSRVAVLVHPRNPSHPVQLKRIMSAAQKVGIQVLLAEAGTVTEVEREFTMLAKERAGGVMVRPDTFFDQESRLIATQTIKHRLPSIGLNRLYAEAGGLLSYGPDLKDNSRRAATYVDKILKGAKPGELPFEQPTRYYFVINLKAAKTLGLSIPPTLQGQADDVIQ